MITPKTRERGQRGGIPESTKNAVVEVDDSQVCSRYPHVKFVHDKLVANSSLRTIRTIKGILDNISNSLLTLAQHEVSLQDQFFLPEYPLRFVLRTPTASLRPVNGITTKWSC
jgi:hypothetical protein